MDGLEQILRDHLRQLPAGSAESTTMLDRVRRRRRRGRLALTGAMGIVLLVTAGVVVSLRGLGGDTDEPLPPVAPPPSPPPSGSVKVAEADFPYFSDPDHGFVLAFSCHTTPCSTYVGATLDAGASWQLHPVTGLAAETFGPRVILRVFDNNNVVLDAIEGDKRWVSNDGAKTWKQVPIGVQGTIDEIPPGALVQVNTNAGARLGLVVTRPDGKSFRLANGPDAPVISTKVDLPVAADGSYWYEGADDTHNWMFFSRDRGRTWRPLSPPPGRPEAGGIGVSADGLMTLDGLTVYWANNGKAWRTTDDGAHWTQLDVSAVPTPQGDYQMQACVRHDNGFQFTDPLTGKNFVVSATGTAFVPGGPQDAVAVPPPNGARFIRSDREKGVISHSVDMVNWIELKFTS